MFQSFKKIIENEFSDDECIFENEGGIGFEKTLSIKKTINKNNNSFSAPPKS